jgi:hypothetical protein
MTETSRLQKMFADLFGDRGPLPEVEVKDSETCWDLWDQAVAHIEQQVRGKAKDAALPPGVLPHAAR